MAKKRTLREQLAARTTDSSRARLLARAGVKPEDRPRSFQTTRGKRRLSYDEAYGRRTTDTSRRRVMALYGKTAPPPPPGNRAGPDRTIHKPVQVPNTGAVIKAPTAPHYRKDNRVTVTFSGRPGRLRHLLPWHLRTAPRAKPGSKKRLF